MFAVVVVFNSHTLAKAEKIENNHHKILDIPPWLSEIEKAKPKTCISAGQKFSREIQKATLTIEQQNGSVIGRIGLLQSEVSHKAESVGEKHQ